MENNNSHNNKRKKKISTDPQIIEIIALRDQALEIAGDDEKKREEVGQICKGMYFCSKKREEAPKDCLPKKIDQLNKWLAAHGASASEKPAPKKKGGRRGGNAGGSGCKSGGKSRSRSRSRSKSRSKPRPKSRSKSRSKSRGKR